MVVVIVVIVLAVAVIRRPLPTAVVPNESQQAGSQQCRTKGKMQDGGGHLEAGSEERQVKARFEASF